MDLSQSDWARYLVCPRQYAWRQAGVPDRLSPESAERVARGQVLDALVGAFYREEWWRDPASLDTRASAYVVREARRRVDEYDLPVSMHAVANYVYGLWRGVRETIARERLLAKYVYVHQNFTRRLGPHTLYGQPDLVLVGADCATALDVKLGASSYIRPGQLRFYAFVLAPHITVPIRTGFWLGREARIRWSRLSREKLQAIETSIWTVLEGIVEERFAPTPGHGCVTCDVRDRCADGIAYLQESPAIEGLPSEPGIHRISF